MLEIDGMSLQINNCIVKFELDDMVVGKRGEVEDDLFLGKLEIQVLRGQSCR